MDEATLMKLNTVAVFHRRMCA